MAGSEDGGVPLGREFLLWLWYLTETQGGLVSSAAGRIGVAFDQVLELSAGDSTGKVTVRGDLPTRGAEADTALKAGKLPVLARLILAHDDDTFEVTLDAATFDLRSVKITAADPPAPGDSAEANEARATLKLRLPVLLDGFYAEFLEARLADDFSTATLAKIRHWVKTRRVRPRTTTA